MEAIIEVSLDSIPLLNVSETSKAVSHSYHLAQQWILDETGLEKSGSNFKKRTPLFSLIGDNNFKNIVARKELSLSLMQPYLSSSLLAQEKLIIFLHAQSS